MTRPNLQEEESRSERAERAANVAAMLERWEAEDVSSEPDWQVEQIDRLVLRAAPDNDKLPPSKP